MEKRQTINNLKITLLNNKMVNIFAKSIGETLNVAPFCIEILAFCKKPRTKEEVVRKFGTSAGTLFSILEDKGFLRNPKEVDIFDIKTNYTNVFGHRLMLADSERLEKYKKAIFETVKKNDIVIDAGSGTGILAIYAALAGAKKVYAIEKTEMAHHIKIIAEKSGFKDVVEVINDDFSQVILPQKADVIVSETVGSLIFKDHAVPHFQKCIANNLKEGGKVIPQGYSFAFASIKKEFDVTLYPFRKIDDEIDLTHLQELSKKRVENFIEIPKEAIVEFKKTKTIFFPTDVAQTKEKFDLTFENPIEAFGAWFDLQLSENVILSTSPLTKQTHWKQTQIPYQNFDKNPKLTVNFFYNGPKRSLLSLKIKDYDNKSEFLIG